MAILIADSGSTKTDWVLVDVAQEQLQTVGLNPYFHEEASIHQVLATSLSGWKNNVDQIYFYGAGCATTPMQEKLRKVFLSFFGSIPIEVSSDILGAAKGLCGPQAGIACILGTGANACLYQNGAIQQQAMGNGIWLGDEGSGGYLGKELIRSYLNQTLPAELKVAFEESYSDRRAEILQRVYRSDHPNRYLASFSKFLGKYQAHPFVRQLLKDAFELFFQYFIQPLATSEENKKLFFTGSVAFYFQEILQEVAQEADYSIAKIEQAPLKGLVQEIMRVSRT